MIDYWYEVDLKGGPGVSQMYVEDGIFNGGGKPLVGRAAIEQFYTWRTGSRRAHFTPRHHEFRAPIPRRDACDDLHCVMMLYAADGLPVLPTAPPIIITDLIDRCVKCDDGKWRYLERTFVPLFMGGAAPTCRRSRSPRIQFRSEERLTGNPRRA